MAKNGTLRCVCRRKRGPIAGTMPCWQCKLRYLLGGGGITVDCVTLLPWHSVIFSGGARWLIGGAVDGESRRDIRMLSIFVPRKRIIRKEGEFVVRDHKLTRIAKALVSLKLWRAW